MENNVYAAREVVDDMMLGEKKRNKHTILKKLIHQSFFIFFLGGPSASFFGLVGLSSTSITSSSPSFDFDLEEVDFGGLLEELVGGAEVLGLGFLGFGLGLALLSSPTTTSTSMASSSEPLLALGLALGLGLGLGLGFGDPSAAPEVAATAFLALALAFVRSSPASPSADFFFAFLASRAIAISPLASDAVLAPEESESLSLGDPESEPDALKSSEKKNYQHLDKNK